ncbi:hypothetical protein PanWU01x14_353960 [Parasponia andersonii]|uniref:Uncharacterized protein n=1 Tax=Parasponia andersonii TaxID=3476 RepID=A0A2P5A9T7_PARAD|nr:hypothetical protein PanWU01x14_353960 [Parasponia andersonii]
MTTMWTICFSFWKKTMGTRFDNIIYLLHSKWQYK